MFSAYVHASLEAFRANRKSRIFEAGGIPRDAESPGERRIETIIAIVAALFLPGIAGAAGVYFARNLPLIERKPSPPTIRSFLVPRAVNFGEDFERSREGRLR
jgi:hypothetical protein